MSRLSWVLVACVALVVCSCSAEAPLPTLARPSSVPSGPTAAPVPDGPGNCPQTAAARYRWGPPTRSSDFAGGLPADWHPYGPEPGHERSGLRTPAAIAVAAGVATIRGSADGTTGAMSWHPGQRYGRWEACVRSDAGSGGLNPVLLLWPVAEDWPAGGEVDWMEISDPTRQETGFFLHFGPDNEQEAGTVTRDATRWTAWALEWTRDRMTAYTNGEPWYSTTDTGHFPPRPMTMTMQLDWFGDADTPTSMQMDWARQWALPESEPATLSLAPGDPATGQPELFPDRVPRPVQR